MTVKYPIRKIEGVRVRYFEDIEVGLRSDGSDMYEVTAEELKTFAGRWDPMPFHIDEEAAARSPLGRLFASSIHTVAIGIRLSHRMMDEEMAVVAGLGWEEVRFPRPVFPGDRLRVAAEVVAKRESASRPDRGICTNQITVINQDGETVASFKIVNMVLKRPGA